MLLPPLAIVAAVIVPGLVIWAAAAAGTFGYDFLAYHAAASRVVDGRPLYDMSVASAGGFGLFLYPPPFAIAMLPLALLPGDVASWVWLALSIAALATAIALMPVGRTVRWACVLLAALSWPTVYALKLGQVGPFLLLLFTIGWRWADRPLFLGVSAALGAAVKVQPGIILLWAFLTRRFLAVAIGAAALAVMALVATAVAGGPAIWPDYLTLLRTVSDPITTVHNFTPGAVAFQMGAAPPVAATIQVVSSAAAVAALLFAIWRLRPDASYLVAVVASQLLSPILWDHYAMLLLLPLAWLLERRQWWAVAIPLASSVLLVPLGLPPVLQPATFWLTLVALLGVGWRDRSPSAAPGPGLAVPFTSPS